MRGQASLGIPVFIIFTVSITIYFYMYQIMLITLMKIYYTRAYAILTTPYNIVVLDTNLAYILKGSIKHAFIHLTLFVLLLIQFNVTE